MRWQSNLSVVASRVSITLIASFSWSYEVGKKMHFLSTKKEMLGGIEAEYLYGELIIL